MGTYQNRLDAKGRVSVPAPFRSELRTAADGEGPVTLILRPSHKYTCIEGWPNAEFKALASELGQYNPFSDAHDDMSAALYADAYPVEVDKEGRIVLGDDLAEHAGLSGQVTFMGVGRIFQIWNPDTAKARRDEARSAARLRGRAMPDTAAA